MIIINNVNYGAPSQILFNIDLKIVDGEMVFLVGEPGAGKTSIIKLIAGMDKPSKGQVNVKGRSISAVSYRGLALARQDMGIIVEGINIFDNLTVNENLELSLMIKGFSAEEIKKKINEFTVQFNLLNKLHFLPKELSSQERKICIFARALISEPTLILVDELLEGIEEGWIKKIVEKLTEIHQKGATIIISLRDRQIMDYFSTRKRIISLSQGKFVNEEIIGKGTDAEIEGLLNNV